MLFGTKNEAMHIHIQSQYIIRYEVCIVMM